MTPLGSKLLAAAKARSKEARSDFKVETFPPSLRYEGVVPHVIAPALKWIVEEDEVAISVLNALTIFLHVF